MKKVAKYRVELVRESYKNYAVDTQINSSENLKSFLGKVVDISTWHNEKLGVVLFDTGMKVLGYQIVSEGTIGEAPAYPREIFLPALLGNAASIAIFHNHPGGSPKHSGDDTRLFTKLKRIGDDLGVKVVDSFVLTYDGDKTIAHSGAEMGL